ncbi:helix-turn-helix transcriptional regulator [Thaumasiovibrio subtropicus]|uniref:helix-turn-helix transcriptional regulator n=1 Tax=Thaumasiovibrio subtropicus TaxID=1891207 RepID=UPI000B3522B3|nr:autoinducer binding domain-containing protein [Thaumasiovibrio subtropicus]
MSTLLDICETLFLPNDCDIKPTTPSLEKTGLQSHAVAHVSLSPLSKNAQFSALLSELNTLGFDQCLFTAVPTYATKVKAKPHFYTNFDADWMAYYIDKHYHLNDKALQHCLAQPDTPLIWPSNKMLNGYNAKERIVRLEAESAGLAVGTTIPCQLPGGLVSTFSLSFDGTAEQFKAQFHQHENMLKTIAHATSHALLDANPRLFTQPFSTILSPREKDTLLWLSEGFTYQQIAQKLGVGESTVRKHVSQILRKLNARNTAQACAMAIRWQLIDTGLIR